jgi:hypothetical protein
VRLPLWVSRSGIQKHELELKPQCLLILSKISKKSVVDYLTLSKNYDIINIEKEKKVVGFQPRIQHFVP